MGVSRSHDRSHETQVKNMDELTEFQQRACAVGVVKMLSGKCFSICDLDALAKTMGREPMMAGKVYAALRAVHCVEENNVRA